MSRTQSAVYTRVHCGVQCGNNFLCAPMAEVEAAGNLSKCCKMICPSAEELSVISNNIRCEQCGLIFRNEPRYRLHDLKVHQRKNLSKIPKENVRYHCPVQTCVYAPTSERYFNTMKYLKQHYLKVHAKKIYPCTRCVKSFSTEAAREGHTRVCGVEFTCSCSKTYTSYEALLTHAKRSFHVIDDKYKNSQKRTTSKMIQVVLPASVTLSGVNKPITILPSQAKIDVPSHNSNVECKVSYDVGVQTEDCRKNRRFSSPSKHNNGSNASNGKRGVSKQTQTNISTKEKHAGKSMETQTMESLQFSKESLKIRKRRKSCGTSKNSECALLKGDLSLADNLASANLFPGSPLPLRHDTGLQDFWEDKNSSSTQTLPEKDMFEVLNDNVTQTEFETFYGRDANPLIQCVPKSTVALMTLPYVEDASTVEGYSFASSDDIPRSDLMLAEKGFDDKFSSIETQTEQAYLQSFFDSDSLSRSFTLSSNIETQTTDDNLDNMEQLLYNNTCTQTCNEILPTDLGLSNIQTQTAWTQLDDTTVSTETQTKSLICQPGCNISMGACRSWLNTQTSHTETQTDLLSIFEGLQ